MHYCYQLNTYRPTKTNSESRARLRNRWYTSIVNKVLAELKIDVKSEINAASMTANINPRRPIGMVEVNVYLRVTRS